MPTQEIKQGSITDNKKNDEKLKTIQELDREKLEKKFSKESKESLN